MSLVAGLLPLMIAALTSFTKVNIVIGMLKNGIGVQHAPGALIEMAISLGISAFIMLPVFEECFHRFEKAGITLGNSLPKSDVLENISEPWRIFLERHSGVREVRELTVLAKEDSAQPPSYRVLLTAFTLTELKQAFSMGFTLLLPFLAIDLIVSNLLAGLGMFMMNPLTISLPLKLILFVVTDGWLLLTKSLILSYGTSA